MTTKIPRYRVVSENGIGFGTKVIDIETGEPIKQISKIVLHVEAGDVWRAELHLVGVAVDVTLLEDSLERKFSPLPQSEK